MRQVYRLAAYFREWDVEGPNGFISKLTLEQFWAWLEFNRLSPFLEEREDLRAAQIASAVYNVNIVEKDALTKPSDFMLPSIDEMIRKEIEKEEQEKEREERERNKIDEDANLEAQLAWKAYIKRLTEGRTPVQKEIRVD